MSDSDARKNNVGGEIICRFLMSKIGKRIYQYLKTPQLKLKELMLQLLVPKERGTYC